MSRYQKFAKSARKYLLVSAAGVAILAPQLGIFAVDSATPMQTVSSQQAGASASPPATLHRSIQQRVQSLYRVGGPFRQSPEPTPSRNVTIQPASPPPRVEQAAGLRRESSNQKSLFDRLVGRLKGIGGGHIPDGPPQDPGMRYPKASQYKTSPPQNLITPSYSMSSANSATPSQPNPLPIIEKAPPSMAPLIPPPIDHPLAPRSFPMESESKPASNLATTESELNSTVDESALIPPMPDADEPFEPKFASRSNPEIPVTQEQPFIKPQEKPIVKSEEVPDQRVAAEPMKAFEPVIEKVPEAKEFAPPVVSAKSSLPVLDLEEIVTEAKPKEASMSVEIVESDPQHSIAEDPASLFAGLKNQDSAEAELTDQQELLVDVPEPELGLDEFFPADESEQKVAVSSQPEAMAKTIDTNSLPEPEINLNPESLADLNSEFFVEENKPATSPTAPSMPTEADMDLNSVFVNEGKQEPSTPEEDEFPAWAMDEDDELAGSSTAEFEIPEEPYTGLSLEEDLFENLPIPSPAEFEPAEISQTETQDAAGYAKLDSQLDSLEKERLDFDLPPLPDSFSEPETQHEPIEPSNPASQHEPKIQESAALTEVPKRTALPTPPQGQDISEQRALAQSREQKAALIASRQGMTGLKGFCPVALRESRELLDTQNQFTAIYHSQEYAFSSAQALEMFLASPEKYAPARRGNDVIHYALTGEQVEGSLDYAVWYRGRLYLFTSVETMETFMSAPNSHVTDL